MSKLFLDASVLMEIMFARSKMDTVSQVLHSKHHEFFVASLTVHILYYFAEVEGIDRAFVARLADLADRLPITAAMVTKAQERYKGKDFEDCLQAACAEAGGCEEIITLDKRFAKDSSTKLRVRVI